MAGPKISSEQIFMDGSKDVTRAHTIAKKVRAGICWINTYHVYDPASPFGGFQMSGFGKELGPHALDGYLQTKSVWVNMGD